MEMESDEYSTSDSLLSSPTAGLPGSELWLLATNSESKNHTFQNNKLQLHGIKLLKFSSLTRNSLSQLAELRERERERERIAYQNGVFKEKNDKEISPALKRFFPSARQSAFDSFI